MRKKGGWGVQGEMARDGREEWVGVRGGGAKVKNPRGKALGERREVTFLGMKRERKKRHGGRIS